MRGIFKRLFLLWQKYEHHLGVGALAVGFSFDLVVAKSPQSVFDNILLVTYLFVAASIIIILNLRKRRTSTGSMQVAQESPTEPLVLLLVLQFCFGGLASNMLVLYGKSGTLAELSFLWALRRAGLLGPKPIVLLGTIWAELLRTLRGLNLVGDPELAVTRIALSPSEAVNSILASLQGVR